MLSTREKYFLTDSIIPPRVVWSEIHRGIAINPGREDLFRDKFVTALKSLGISPLRFGHDPLRNLTLLIFNAVQNIYDHANRKPFPDDPHSITSSVSLICHTRIDPHHYNPSERLAAYLERLYRNLPEKPDFLEITVRDDGVGIAARQALNSQIYWGPFDEEIRVFHEALSNRGSSKLAASDCPIRGTPGYGFTYIKYHLRSVHAYALLRTGRILATFDLTSEWDGFGIESEIFGYLPGTRLDVIVPILKH